jgi:hypothetical protein
MQYVLAGLIAALVVVFGASANSKVRSRAAHGEFVDSLRDWRVVPARLVAPVAVAVTGAEIAIVAGGISTLAASVIVSSWRTFALLTLAVAAPLLAALTVGIMMAMRRGADAQCACFGATARPLSGVHVVRDLVLLAATAGGLVLAATGPDRLARPAGALLALVAGTVCGLVVVRLDDMIELFSPVPTSR